MIWHYTALLGLALICSALTPAAAGAVHKWVDEHGVTHYSDEPPDNTETTLIELPEPTIARTASEDGGLADDYYSISNQWARMNEERLERERLDLERDRIRAARQTPVPAPAAGDSGDEVRYVPVYSGFGYYRPHRRHHGRHHGGMRPHPRPQPRQPSLGTFPTQ